MRNYVAGFMFDNGGSAVALVEKKKFPPGVDWSKTPLNAIGGKIDFPESPAEAMIREFNEEAGVETEPLDWDQFLTLSTSEWQVFFFRCFNTAYLHYARTTEEEAIWKCQIGSPELLGVVPNLKWILPMALDKSIKFADIIEKE